jgi:nucleotide-binding universal stress UspA family protein
MKPPKIVLLTDFSPLSLVAMKFAVQMAAPLHAEFTILSTVRIEGPSRANLKLRHIEKLLLDEAQDQGKALVKELRATVKGDYALRFVAMHGHTVAETIKIYTQKNSTNMVVMGSRGASTLKKARMGGTTVSVIDDCPVPVMAIPELAQYKNLQHIVYASDLKNVQKELEILIEFATIFGSHIHMIHVATSIDKQAGVAHQAVVDIIQKLKYGKLDFKVIIDDNIPAAIDKFIKDSKSDLLTTFTHHLSLYEKLFARSTTRTLAYLGTIPLLAIKHK